MIHDRDELIEHYRRTRADLLATIDGLNDGLMADPSIDGWSVKDHLAHIAVWDDLRTSEVTRISAGHDSAWRIVDEQEEAFNRIVYELRRDLSLGQVRWEVETSRQRLLEAIAAATPRGLDDAHYGDVALRSDHEVGHTSWIRRWRGERGI